MIRSEEEIAEWLKEQFWYDRWLRNLKVSFEDCSDLEQVVQDFVKGRMAGGSIMRAFSWVDTPEGGDFWKTVDDYFHLWYLFNERKIRLYEG